MQPTYLPWSGYFNLVARVDDFVFLDDVQFERRSWQSRNRILLDGREHLLTVPVRKSPREARIHEIAIDDGGAWRSQHAKVLEAAYRQAPHGGTALQLVLPHLADTALRLLADLNIRIIESICALFPLPARMHRASRLGCPGDRSEHLARICEAVGTDDYLSPAGSREYLEQDRFAERYGKRLTVQQFAPAPYAQRRAPAFVSHLSILDVIAHLGPSATFDYIRGTSHEDRSH